MPDASTFAKRFAAVLGKDGERSPPSTTLLERISAGLVKFSGRELRLLERSGATILIADPRSPPSGGYPGDMAEWPRGLDGYYEEVRKIVVLRKDKLTLPVIVHELAHALDDALVPDQPLFYSGKELAFKSDRRGKKIPFVRSLMVRRDRVLWRSDDPKLVGFYENFVVRFFKCLGLAPIWCRYALRNEREYFAEGLRISRSGGLPQLLLRWLDPQFHEFLQELRREGKG